MGKQEIPEQVRGKIAQFQTLQQQLQMVSMQKQQLMVQKIGYDDASEALSGVKGDVYKSVGPILVKSDASSLKEELLEKSQSAESRISLLESQEEKLVSKISELQKDLQTGLSGAGASLST